MATEGPPLAIGDGDQPPCWTSQSSEPKEAAGLRTLLGELNSPEYSETPPKITAKEDGQLLVLRPSVGQPVALPGRLRGSTESVAQPPKHVNERVTACNLGRV